MYTADKMDHRYCHGLGLYLLYFFLFAAKDIPNIGLLCCLRTERGREGHWLENHVQNLFRSF